MYRKFFKRFFDIIFSTLGLLILSPLLLTTYILVLIFLGFPGIFKQERPGKDEKIFKLYKFRTMTNAKDKKGRLLPDDKRLTKFGKFLRSTSIDELPELFNILKGDMSFVGPRPMLVRDMVFFDHNTKKRQSVRPGLTGLAQASGRNSLNWDDRFKYDLAYIKTITLINDARIICKTIQSVLAREGIGNDGSDLSIDYGDYLLKNKVINLKVYNEKQEEAEDILQGIICHKEKGLVSIITPSYNTGRYIAETINSVQKQTYKNWELIIVDDCSTDNTDKVVQPFLNDKRIKYIKNTHNSGAAISRNTALQYANGEYIAFLDSDDIWDRNKLKAQIEFMMRNGYYFTYSTYELIDEGSKSLKRIVRGPKRITRSGMYNYCWPGCLTVMYNQNKIGQIQIKNLSKNNDYAIWLKAIKRADCYLLDNLLAKYRIRKGSISRNRRKASLIKYHYKLFRIGEEKNIFTSIVLTMRNLFFGVFKKAIYEKGIK